MGNFMYYYCRELFLVPLRIFTRLDAKGAENFPKTGPALLLSNHISHFDPPFMARTSPRVIHFMADKPLLEIPVVGNWMLKAHVFPIDRTKNDRSALRTAIKRLEQGNIVCIFPERGIRQRETSVLGGADMPIGTAGLWKMMDVPVIPMIIIGSDQVYGWKKLWKRPRVWVRVGPMLPCDQSASKEDLRDRLAKAWRDLYADLMRECDIKPEELPQTAQERWGQPRPEPETVGPAVED